MPFCTVVKHGFGAAGKRLNRLRSQVWAALRYRPGWATAKVGVKMHVWTHDTDFCNPQRAVLGYFCPLESRSEGHILTEGNGLVFCCSGAQRCQNLLSWHLFWGCTWVYVGAPPTEWVCIVLWLIPLFITGLGEFNTQTHWTEHIWASRASTQKNKSCIRLLRVRRCPTLISR